MEIGGLDVESGHLGVGDLDAFRIVTFIEATSDREPCVRSGAGDQLDDDQVADQWLAAPVLRDEGKQPMLSSRAGEFPPRALLEPYLKLSLHTAPDVRSPTRRSNGFALSTELLPLSVGSGPRLNNAAPSVRSHYRTFNPTTNCSAPVPRIGTLVLVVFATWTSPFASGRQVLTFHTRA